MAMGRLPSSQSSATAGTGVSDCVKGKGTQEAKRAVCVLWSACRFLRSLSFGGEWGFPSLPSVLGLGKTPLD